MKTEMQPLCRSYPFGSIVSPHPYLIFLSVFYFSQPWGFSEGIWPIRGTYAIPFDSSRVMPIVGIDNVAETSPLPLIVYV